MANNEGKKSKKTLFIILGVILALIILVMALGGNDDSSTDTAANNGATTAAATDGTTAAPETTTAAEKDFYVVGETYTGTGLTVAFTGANENFTEIMPYSEIPAGMKVVQATFDFTNTGNSDQLISSGDFDCYADNVSCESFLYVDNSSFLDTLSAGRQATGKSVYFQVPDTAQNIVIEYEPNMFSSKKVVFQVK